MTPRPDGSFSARFHAKYARIFGFSYTATLAVQTNGPVFNFQGDADLGKLAGGIYRYEGSISNGRFSSTYQSKYDHGTFDMTRP